MKRRTLLTIAATAAWLTGCSSLQTTTTREHEDLESHLLKVERVVIAPPEVSIALIKVSGDNERIASLEHSTRQGILNLARRDLRVAGYEVVEFDFAKAIAEDEDFAFTITQVRDAFDMARQELRAGRELSAAQKRAFNASVGSAVNAVSARTDADAVLLLRYAGFRKSEGMVTRDVASSVAFAILTMGQGLLVHNTSGAQIEAALIDGVTGDVLWTDSRAGSLDASIATAAMSTLPRDIDPQGAVPAAVAAGAPVPVLEPASGELQTEISNYREAFSGELFEVKFNAMQNLTWSGISDPAVFDPVEAELLRDYASPSPGRTGELSHLAKALGLSGNDKYRATLETVARDTKAYRLAKYSREALTMLDQHAAWNPVILAGVDQPGPWRLDELRTYNLLMAEDPELIRVGAKNVYARYLHHRRLLEVTLQSLQHNQARDLDNDVQVDAVNWLMKALANSGDMHYHPALLQIAAESQDRSIASHARRYAELLAGLAAPRQ